MNDQKTHVQPAGPQRRVMDMHAPGYVPPSLKPAQVAVAMPRHAFPKKLVLLCTTAAAVLLLAPCGYFYWHSVHTSPVHSAKTVSITNDAYKIVDDPLGLAFSISKAFQLMPSDDLKKLNPYFVYGYDIADVAHVRCVIAQTSRTDKAVVSPDDLGKGTFAQLKASYPDATASGYQAIRLKNGRAAAELIASYHEDGTLIKQVEVVAATDTRTSFAFCTSPASLYTYYVPKFNLFFRSLLVY